MGRFLPGQSGNPNGAPDREDRASIKRAFIKILSAKPWLLETAIENGLTGRSPLGYLELAARLMKEIGVQGDSPPQIAIIFNSSLDSSKLKEGSTPIRIIEKKTHQLPAHLEPALESTERAVADGYPGKTVEPDLDLLEDTNDQS